MDHSSTDAALLEYLARNPKAQHAALHDPEYAAEVHRLRMVLDSLHAALSAEKMPAEARHRVGARLVADCLGTDEANVRMRDQARRAQQLLTQPAGFAPVD
ncbi:hypothetical protein [Streptomyces sulphureus]|uniref:hypothetical protein n=1 Tax=Streptomyces sulphureus TaxID=47758 RepID=UPI00035F9010|nr:hypothetical protein [Streptomyces sulphureus]